MISRLFYGVLWSVIGILTFITGQNHLPQLSPFFFLCNYHGNVQELGQHTSEVKLSVSIDGNPDTYVPGEFYQGMPVSPCFNMKLYEIHFDNLQ